MFPFLLTWNKIGIYNEPVIAFYNIFNFCGVQPGKGQISAHTTVTDRHTARRAGPEPWVLIRILHVKIGGEFRVDTDSFDH